MGCSDSTAMENHMQSPNDISLLNPHKYPPSQEATDEFEAPSEIKMHSKQSESQFNSKTKNRPSSYSEDLF